MQTYAQYSGGVGDKITIRLSPETDSNYPQFSGNSCQWYISSGNISAVSLVSKNDEATLTILSYFSGSITIMCRYQVRNEAKKSYLNKIASYTVTCSSNPNDGGSGGGGGTGGGGGSGGGSSDDDDFIFDYTKEGYRMRFYLAKNTYGETIATVSGTADDDSCVPDDVSGRVTIPSYAKGYRVTNIDTEAFYYLRNLTEVVIPSTMLYVMGDAFYMCSNLKSIICEASTPPTCSTRGKSVCSNDYSVVLYVPKGTKSLYANANGWSNFSKINEIGQKEAIVLSASPAGGIVEKGTIVKLTTDVSGADIYYTLNGTTPSKSSNRYNSSGITINESCTLKAIAYKDGYEDSDVLTEKYTVNDPDLKITLSASPKGGEIEKGTIVHLYAQVGSAALGDGVYYTLDGSTPSEKSTKYQFFDGITINESCTLKAIAYYKQYVSDVLTEKYTIKNGKGIAINATNFPDEYFRKYLLEQDYGIDGVITEEEIGNITRLSLYRDYPVKNMQGIEFFEYLQDVLIFSDKLTSLDVSKNRNLTTLSFGSSSLKSDVLEKIIKTLPPNVYTEGHMFVVNKEDLLSSQLIADIRSRGWTPRYGIYTYYRYQEEDPTGINMTESSLSLNIGEKFKIGYTMTPATAVRDVTWSSANSSVAQVDVNGVVTGNNNGITYVTATTKNGIEGRCKVTVGNAPSIAGDVNGDGQVTGTDLVALVNIILGKIAKNDAADLNGDGVVNGVDYVKLVNIILGK